jgi:quercetin dioxygenase-like cupin family protein
VTADTGRYLIGTEQGKSVSLGGMGVVYKISGETTQGAFAVVEHPIEPGILTPPHVHEREDEYSYVLEGEVGFRIGDAEFTAGPGCYVLKPRGVPHALWNAGPAPARLLEIIAPSGFEHYFEEWSEMIAHPPVDPDRLTELRQRYHRGSVGWGPELMAKYHLRLMGQPASKDPEPD